MAEFAPYPHPRFARAVAFAYGCVLRCLPLWHTAGGWRKSLWFEIAGGRWFWSERAEGRL